MDESSQSERLQPDPREIEEARQWLRDLERRGVVRVTEGRYGAEHVVPPIDRASETHE